MIIGNPEPRFQVRVRRRRTLTGGSRRFWCATFARRTLREGYNPGDFNRKCWITRGGLRLNIPVQDNAGD